MEMINYMIAGITGQEWPADAVYAMHYEVQAWPTNARRHVSYFRNMTEVMAFIRAQKEFARLEDNYYTPIRFEKWDWGPVVVKEYY